MSGWIFSRKLNRFRDEFFLQKNGQQRNFPANHGQPKSWQKEECHPAGPAHHEAHACAPHPDRCPSSIHQGLLRRSVAEYFARRPTGPAPRNGFFLHGFEIDQRYQYHRCPGSRFSVWGQRGNFLDHFRLFNHQKFPWLPVHGRGRLHSGAQDTIQFFRLYRAGIVFPNGAAGKNTVHEIPPFAGYRGLLATFVFLPWPSVILLYFFIIDNYGAKRQSKPGKNCRLPKMPFCEKAQD